MSAPPAYNSEKEADIVCKTFIEATTAKINNPDKKVHAETLSLVCYAPSINTILTFLSLVNKFSIGSVQISVTSGLNAIDAQDLAALDKLFKCDALKDTKIQVVAATPAANHNKLRIEIAILQSRLQIAAAQK